MQQKIVTCRLFQTPQILVDGNPVVIRLKKSAALLYYLLVHKQVSREEIIHLLWADSPIEAASRSLRDALYRLKKDASCDLVVSKGRSVLVLNPEYHFDIDLDRLLSSDEHTDYPGAFLPGFQLDTPEFDEWLDATQHNFHLEFLRQLNQAGQKASDQGNIEQAIYYWEQYLQIDPLSESVAESLMRAYRTRENYSQAALIYHKLCKALSSQLGVSPLNTISSLFQEIMVEWNTKSTGQEELIEDFLVGRHRLYQEMLQRFTNSSCRSFALCGSAGVGKTHLLKFFLRHADISQSLVVSTRCFESKQSDILTPWMPVVSSISQFIIQNQIEIPASYLRATAPLFPDLAFIQSDCNYLDNSFTLPSSYRGLLGIFSLVSAHTPILLAVDDIQWIDSSSLTLLEFLLRELNQKRFSLILTCRPTSNPTVSNFLNCMQSDRLLNCFTLEPFNKEETAKFVAYNTEKRLAASAQDHIYHITQGNAFLLNQVLQQMEEDEDSPLFSGNLEQIVQFHLDRLPPEAQQVLELVSMFPDHVPYDFLQVISNQPSYELLHICQELYRRSLIVDYTENNTLYLTFSQPEVQKIIHARIRPLKRRYAHANIANALLSCYPSLSSAQESQLVYHYQQSGDLVSALFYRIQPIKRYVQHKYVLSAVIESSTDLWFDFIPDPLKELQSLLSEVERLKKSPHSTELLRTVEQDALYVLGGFCIYTCNYTTGIDAIQKLLGMPGLSEEMQELANEHMISYGIQTYQTDILQKHVSAFNHLVQNKDLKRRAVGSKYLGCLLVMQGIYDRGRETLFQALSLIDKSYSSGWEHTHQTAYTYLYVSDSYRKEGQYQLAQDWAKKALSTVSHYGQSQNLHVYRAHCMLTSICNGELDSARQLAVLLCETTGQRGDSLMLYAVVFSYRAVFCLTEGNDQETAYAFQLAEMYAARYQSLYELGVLCLLKGMCSLYCENHSGEFPETEQHLVKTPEMYLKQVKKNCSVWAGKFEQELIAALERKDFGPLEPIFHS